MATSTVALFVLLPPRNDCLCLISIDLIFLRGIWMRFDWIFWIFDWWIFIYFFAGCLLAVEWYAGNAVSIGPLSKIKKEKREEKLSSSASIQQLEENESARFHWCFINWRPMWSSFRRISLNLTGFPLPPSPSPPSPPPPPPPSPGIYQTRQFWTSCINWNHLVISGAPPAFVGIQNSAPAPRRLGAPPLPPGLIAVSSRSHRG